MKRFRDRVGVRVKIITSMESPHKDSEPDVCVLLCRAMQSGIPQHLVKCYHLFYIGTLNDSTASIYTHTHTRIQKQTVNSHTCYQGIFMILDTIAFHEGVSRFCV